MVLKLVRVTARNSLEEEPIVLAAGGVIVSRLRTAPAVGKQLLSIGTHSRVVELIWDKLNVAVVVPCSPEAFNLTTLPGSVGYRGCPQGGASTALLCASRRPLVSDF